MNIVTFVLGIAFIGYGIFTLIMRIKSPNKFHKIEAMKERFGDTTGIILHIVSYTVLPIVAGIVFAICGFSGIALF